MASMGQCGWQMSTEQWWFNDCQGKTEERHQRHFVHADCSWVSRDRKWRSKVDRQISSVWVIAVPGRTAKGEMKEQTEQAQAVSPLATGWTFRGPNTGRSKRVYFLKKPSEFIFSKNLQIESEVHPASFSMGTNLYFPGGKAAVAWTWLLTSI